MKKILNEIGLSFSFLTRIPVKISGKVGDPAFFVLVGYAVGLAYLALLRLTQFMHLPGPLSVIIVMAVVYYFFELFHFDGLLDTFDGFLCQKEKNERIEIMKKGNIGPFALFYGVLFILAHFYLLNQLVSRPLLIFVAGPVSRWSMLLLLAISRPAKNEGLAASFYPFLSRSFLWAGIFLLPVIILAPVFTAVALAGVIAITLVVNLAARKLISGVTGDILGATCLIAEVCSLFFLSVIPIQAG
ncbi:MAG: adenosylcobinamide-GDP ribazoletransferase [Candidatus Omnitrophota bacterium]|nr:adenosylcobinamide-GDP ribazoletransferase [Candidatus Omnitrophota bacterium]